MFIAIFGLSLPYWKIPVESKGKNKLKEIRIIFIEFDVFMLKMVYDREICIKVVAEILFNVMRINFD